MKRITLLALLSVANLCVAAERVHVDLIPFQPLSEIDRCVITKNSLIVATHKPATLRMRYTVPIPSGQCTRASDKWSGECFPVAGNVNPGPSVAVSVTPDACNPITAPPVVIPPVTPYPAPTGFKIAGTTASCTTPAGAQELRMFTVRADGKLGDRVKTFRRCPTTYAFVSGKKYVLKAVFQGDKLSGWSNVVAP